MEPRRTSVSDTLYMHDRENIRRYDGGLASDEDEDENDDDDDDEGRLQIDLGMIDEERSEPNKSDTAAQHRNVAGASSKTAGKDLKSKIAPLERLQQLVQAPFFASQMTTAGGNAIQGCDTYTALCGSSTVLTNANKQLSLISSAMNNGELANYPFILSSHPHHQQQQQPHTVCGAASLPTLTPRPGSASQIDQNGSPQSTSSYVGASSMCTTTITPINNANAAINYSRMQRVRNKLKEAAIDEMNIRKLQKLGDDEAQSFHKFRETVLQSSLAAHPVDGLRNAFKSPLKLPQPDLVTVTAVEDDSKSSSPLRQLPSAIELATGVRTPPTLTVISYRGHTHPPAPSVSISSLPSSRVRVNSRRSPPPMVPIESLANFRMPREDGVCGGGKTIEDNVMTRLKKLGTDIELEKTPSAIPSFSSSVTCTPTLPDDYDAYGYSVGMGEDEEEDDDDDLPSFPFAVDCVLSTESSPPSPPPTTPLVTKTNSSGYVSSSSSSSSSSLSLKQLPSELSNSMMVAGRLQPPPPPNLIPIGCSPVPQQTSSQQQQQHHQQQAMAQFVPIIPQNWMNSVGTSTTTTTGVAAPSPETTIAAAAPKKRKKATLTGGGIHKKPKTNKSDIAKLAHALVMQPGMTAPPTIVIATNDENDAIKTTTVMVKPQSSPFLAADDGKQPFTNEVEIIKIQDGPPLSSDTPITVALTQQSVPPPPSSSSSSSSSVVTTPVCSPFVPANNQLLSVTATAPMPKMLQGASAALDQTMVCSQVVGSGRKLYSCSICSSVYHKPYNVRKHVYRQHLNLRYIVEKEAKKYEIGWPLETAGLGPTSDETGLFRCDTCYRIFDERDALKLHLLEHPPREDVMSKSRVGRFPCPSCALKFSKKKVYLRHLKECQEHVASQGAYELKPLTVSSSSSTSTMLAVATSTSPPCLAPAITANEEAAVKCESVAATLPPPTLSSLPPPLATETTNVTADDEVPAEQEERKDEDEDVEETVNRLCLFCDLEFTNNAARQRHVLQNHHPKRKRQSCAYCKKRGFTDLRDLLRHIVSSHSDIYFGCVSCKVRFKTNDELTAHDIESHQSEESSPKKAEGGEKRVEKTDSTETTQRPPIVANNAAATAAVKNGKTYKCSSCTSFFGSMTELCRHRKAEHRAPRSTIRNTSNTNDYDTKYRNTVITSTDYETEFYRNLSNNVRLNLEVHMEGKIADARRPTDKAMTRSCLASMSSGDKERVGGADGQRDRENDAELSFQDMYGAENISGRFIRNVSRLHLETQLTMLKKANLLNKNVGGDTGLPNARNECIASELSLTPQKTESEMAVDQPYEEETSHVGVIFSGEWIKEKKYVCAACFQSFNGFWEWDDHRWTKHPNVWNTYYVFPSEHAPGRNWAMKLSLKSVGVLGKCNDGKSTPPPPPITYATNAPSSMCTKCQKMITPLSEFHKHILECGGDANWMATVYTPTKRHRKWKPYCGHRRKKTVPKRRMFLRNIPETPVKLPTLSRSKHKAGDSETIQRMIANLPPKRITRRVVSFDDDVDSKNRKRGKVRGCVLTRQRRERLDPKTSAQIAKTFGVDNYDMSETTAAAVAALKREKQPAKRKAKADEETCAQQQQRPPASSSSREKSVSPKLEIEEGSTSSVNDENAAGGLSNAWTADDACPKTVAKTEDDDSSLELSKLPLPPCLTPATLNTDAMANEDDERNFELMTMDATAGKDAPSLPDSAVILAAMRETMRQTDVSIPNQVFKHRKRKRGESKRSGGKTSPTTTTTDKRRRSSSAATAAAAVAVEMSPHFICRDCGSVVFGSTAGADECCGKCRSKRKDADGERDVDDDESNVFAAINATNRRETDEIIRATVAEMLATVCEANPSSHDAAARGSRTNAVRAPKSHDLPASGKATTTTTTTLDHIDETIAAVSAFESAKRALFQESPDDASKANAASVATASRCIIESDADDDAAAAAATSSISKYYHREPSKTAKVYDDVSATTGRRRSTLSSEESNAPFERRASTNGEYSAEESNTPKRRKSSDVYNGQFEDGAKEFHSSASKLSKSSEMLDKGKNNAASANVSNIILQCKGCYGQFVTVSSYKEHSEKCPFHNANQETDKRPLLGFAKRNLKKKSDDATGCESGGGGPSFEILESVPTAKSLDGSPSLSSSDGGKSPVVDLSSQSENLVPPVLFDGDTMCGPLRRTVYRKASQQSILDTINSVIQKFCKSSANGDDGDGGSTTYDSGGGGGDDDEVDDDDEDAADVEEEEDDDEEGGGKDEQAVAEPTRKKKSSKTRREPVEAAARNAAAKADTQRGVANRSQSRRELRGVESAKETSDDDDDDAETSADERAAKVAESTKNDKKSRQRTKAEPPATTTARRNVESRTSKRRKHESSHRARAQRKLRRAADGERPLSKRIMAAKIRRTEQNANETTAKSRAGEENAIDTPAGDEPAITGEGKTLEAAAAKTRRTIGKSSSPTPPVRVLRSKRKTAELTPPQSATTTTEDDSMPKNVEAADERVSNARSKKSKTIDEAECAKADSSAMNVINDGSNGGGGGAETADKDEFREPAACGKSSLKRQPRNDGGDDDDDDDDDETSKRRRNSNDLGFPVAKTAIKAARRRSKSSTGVAHDAPKEGDTKARRRKSVARIAVTQRPDTKADETSRAAATVTGVELTASASTPSQAASSPGEMSPPHDGCTFLGVPPSIPCGSETSQLCVSSDEPAASSRVESVEMNAFAFGAQYADDAADCFDGQSDTTEQAAKPWYSQAIDFLGQRSVSSLGSIINSVNELLANPDVASSCVSDDTDSYHEEALRYCMDENRRDDNFATFVKDFECGVNDRELSTFEDDHPLTLMDLDKQSKADTRNGTSSESDTRNDVSAKSDGQNESDSQDDVDTKEREGDEDEEKAIEPCPANSSAEGDADGARKENETETHTDKVKTLRFTTIYGSRKLNCNHCDGSFDSKDEITAHVQEHLRKFAMSRTDNAVLLRKCITKKFKGLLVERALTNLSKSPQNAMNCNNNSLKSLSMMGDAKKNQLSTWKNAISQMLTMDTNASAEGVAAKATVAEPTASEDKPKNTKRAHGDRIDNGKSFPCPMCSKTFEQTTQRNRHLIMVHAGWAPKKTRHQSERENCSDDVSTTAEMIESYLMTDTTIDACSTQTDKQVTDLPARPNGVVEAKSKSTLAESETTTNCEFDGKAASSNSSTVKTKKSKSKNASHADNTHAARSDKSAAAAAVTVATSATTATTTGIEDVTNDTSTKSADKKSAKARKKSKKPSRRGRFANRGLDLPPDLVKRKAEQALRELTFGRFSRFIKTL